MHLILTSLIIIDVAHGLKKNYATNNHSSLVCTETEKKKKEKKKRQTVYHKIVQRLLSGRKHLSHTRVQGVMRPKAISNKTEAVVMFLLF